MEESEALNIVSALIPFAIIVFIIALGVVLLTQQFRKNLYKQQLARESMKNEHQLALLNTTIQVQENERRRIAKDLHDELGAVLSIGKMWMLQLEGQDEIEKKKLKDVRELLENAMSSTRRISHELMPLQLSNLGLQKALLSLCKAINQSNELFSKVEVDENLGPLPAPIELTLYRIGSELINNTLKHADASTFTIWIRKVSDDVVLEYQDNGKGLTEKQLEEGLGLKSIEGRVSALKGTWDYGNRAEGGFFARLVIPLE